MRYQNLTRKPELFLAPWDRALLGPGPGTMYPLNPPLAGSARKQEIIGTDSFLSLQIM